MPHALLDALTPELDALPAADVRRPGMPLHIAFQEAHDALVFAEQPEVLAKLVAVGFAPGTLIRARRYLLVAREAEAQWAAVRSPRKPEDQRALQEAGATHKAAMIAAIRWNLRDARAALGALDRLGEGHGVPGLIQDLLGLATLVSQHLAAFQGDQTFDAPAAIVEAHRVAEEIRLGLSAYRNDATMAQALDRRDRAWTLLTVAMGELRDAGQYAFRATGDARRFTSAYERRRRLAHKRAARDRSAPAPAEGTP